MSYLKKMKLIATRGNAFFYIDEDGYLLHLVRRFANKLDESDIVAEAQTFNLSPVMIRLLLEFVAFYKKCQDEKLDANKFFASLSFNDHVVINDKIAQMLKEYPKESYPEKPTVLEPDEYYNDNDIVGSLAQTSDLKMLTYIKRNNGIKEFMLYQIGFAGTPTMLVTIVEIGEHKDQKPFVLSYTPVALDIPLAHEILKYYFDKRKQREKQVN